MARMREQRAWLVALIAALALAACGGDEPPATVEAEPTPTATVTPVSTPTATATPTLTPLPPTPPHTMESCKEHIGFWGSSFAVSSIPLGGACLIVLSDGSPGILILEWMGGDSAATKWQYRKRLWTDDGWQSWGAWTDIAGSDASTRSHRLSGLGGPNAYEFEVRPLRDAVAGAHSNTASGFSQAAGEIPRIGRHRTVEGDGRMEWRLSQTDIVITIPLGVRITGGGSWVNGHGGLSIFDTVTGSSLEFYPWGTVQGRYIEIQAGAVATAPAWDVNALFDQIIASIRLSDR